MTNLTAFYNNNRLEKSENLYLSFVIGESRYAIKIEQVVEIMKLPMLDYPQKLPNNIVGLLNYNNFTINVLDLRFYLDIKVTPYSISNQLLIIKTDESIFGLLIDKVEDIISPDTSRIDSFTLTVEQKIIEFMYKDEKGTISIINPNVVEEIIKTGTSKSDVDIPALFPNDDDSRYKMMQRSQALVEKEKFSLTTGIFSQDRFISFSLASNNYCISLEYVKEFLKKVDITSIPCDFDYIAGVIALRGDFITVINTKKFLQIEDENQETPIPENKNNVIVLETPDYTIGFLVDNIYEIINIPEELIKKNIHKQTKYNLSEVILENDLYIILDIKNILADEKLFIEE